MTYAKKAFTGQGCRPSPFDVMLEGLLMTMGESLCSSAIEGLKKEGSANDHRMIIE